VRYERVGAAALLTIDRPERRNAVDAATARALRAGFESFEADDAPAPWSSPGPGRGVLRRSRPEGARPRRRGPGRADGLQPARRLEADDRGDRRLVPGGRVELALWCDLRLATPASTFGLFERRWGVPLIDGGTQRLPRIVGLGRALDLILTGRPVDAAEAERIGLITAVTAPGEHVERALALAEQLAGFPRRRCSPTAAPRSRGSGCRSPRASSWSTGSAARRSPSPPVVPPVLPPGRDAMERPPPPARTPQPGPIRRLDSTGVPVSCTQHPLS